MSVDTDYVFKNIAKLFVRPYKTIKKYIKLNLKGVTGNAVYFFFSLTFIFYFRFTAFFR